MATTELVLTGSYTSGHTGSALFSSQNIRYLTVEMNVRADSDGAVTGRRFLQLIINRLERSCGTLRGEVKVEILTVQKHSNITLSHHVSLENLQHQFSDNLNYITVKLCP